MRKEIECLYRITNPYTQDIRIANPNERRWAPLHKAPIFFSPVGLICN